MIAYCHYCDKLIERGEFVYTKKIWLVNYWYCCDECKQEKNLIADCEKGVQ